METKLSINVSYSVQCTLTEGELRGLDAIVGYGYTEFMKVFKTRMGEHYITGYEKDVESLFKKVETLRPKLHEIDKARQAMNKITHEK